VLCKVRNKTANEVGRLLTTSDLMCIGIMSYRVSSMYNHNNKIIVVLVAALVLEVCLVVLVQILTLGVHAREQLSPPTHTKFQTNNHDLIAVPQPAPGVQLCAQDSFPSWMYTLWIPIIMFELLVLLLSLFLAVKYYQPVRLMRENNTDPPDSLPYILLRDSITFPFM
jgi:hypothetical protein